MRDAKGLFIAATTKIRDAIAIIDREAVQIALIVDSRGRLEGTLTDGDVRRAMLAGTSLDADVGAIMHTSPSTVGPEAGPTELLALMGSRRIHQIPVVDPERRVVGIHLLDDLLRSTALGTRGRAKAMELSGEILPEPGPEHWVVLLAGGRGRRLAPITKELPKPMIPVGQKPILESIIASLAEAGFQRFFLAVNYMAEVIEDHFGDGSDFGVTIEYLRESAPLGTAGALSLLPERPTGPLLIMNGDLLTKMDPRQLLRFHLKEGAAGTMCVREYDIQVPFGVVALDGQRMRSLDEKPVHRFFVNAGIYLLEPEVLDLLPPGGHKNMTTVFEELVETGREAAVFPVREYWLDIGRMSDLERARDDAAEVLG